MMVLFPALVWAMAEIMGADGEQHVDESAVTWAWVHVVTFQVPK
jgi:hypothetical protein